MFLIILLIIISILILFFNKKENFITSNKNSCTDKEMYLKEILDNHTLKLVQNHETFFPTIYLCQNNKKLHRSV